MIALQHRKIMNDIAQGLEITVATLLDGEKFEPPQYDSRMRWFGEIGTDDDRKA